MADINVEEMIHELLNTEAKIRQMTLALDTKIMALEVAPSASQPPEKTPEKVEFVTDKISLAVKNFQAQYRKYYHLYPQRRQHVTRRSFREDSGIGSGIFYDDDPTATEVCATPIQESQETINTEKSSPGPVEHSEGQSKVDSEDTSGTVPGMTEVTHV